MSFSLSSFPLLPSLVVYKNDSAFLARYSALAMANQPPPEGISDDFFEQIFSIPPSYVPSGNAAGAGGGPLPLGLSLEQGSSGGKRIHDDPHGKVVNGRWFLRSILLSLFFVLTVVAAATPERKGFGVACVWFFYVWLRENVTFSLDLTLFLWFWIRIGMRFHRRRCFLLDSGTSNRIIFDLTPHLRFADSLQFLLCFSKLVFQITFKSCRCHLLLTFI